MTKQSASITNLAVALAAAQAEMPVVKMNMENKFLKAKYADLGAIIEASRPILAKHGLSITQFPVSNEQGRIGLTSLLLHTTGEFLEDTIYMNPEQSKGLSSAQSAGVIISYLRRYAWGAILGMYSEEDIDAEVRSADDNVKEILADLKTGEIKIPERTWSFTQMDELLELSAGFAKDYEEAAQILNMSILPENAPGKTIASWFRHWLNAPAQTSIGRASYANDKFESAVKKSNGGK